MSTPLALLVSAIAGLGAGFVLHSPVMALITGAGVYVLILVLRIGRSG